MIFDAKYTPILGAQGFQAVDMGAIGYMVRNLPFGLPAGATAAVFMRNKSSASGFAFFEGDPSGLTDADLLMLAGDEKLFLTNAEQISTLVLSSHRFLIQFFTGGQGSSS